MLYIFFSPCRFSCDFICHRTSAYIVVVAQFFSLVFLSISCAYSFFFLLFLTFILLPTNLVQMLLLLHFYRLRCVFFFFCSIRHWQMKIPMVVCFSRVGPPRLYPSKSLNDNRTVQSQSHSRHFSLTEFFFLSPFVCHIRFVFIFSTLLFSFLKNDK